MASTSDRDEPGLFLQLEITAATVRVTYAAPLARVGRSGLRPPFLNEEAGPALRGSSELVLAVLDERGLREQFAWSMRAVAFTDREDEDGSGALRGTPRDSRLATRVLRVPAPAEATFALLYTTEWLRDAGGGESPLVRRVLGLYYLGDGDLVPPLPPWPFPWLPPLPWPLPFPPQRLYRPRPPRPVTSSEGTNTLVDSGSPQDRFDIVILGDGFTHDELAEFDARAKALSDGLMAMAPFNALAGKINIHTVRAASLQSGITDCPAVGTAVSTYFGTRGNFNGQYPGFVGAPDPERIYQAAEIIAPRQYLDVFLVIANCDIQGGSAFPSLRLAFITMYTDLTKFVNFAAHELGHVIGRTAEEYIGCAEWDPLNVYPNQGTEAQRAADTLPWKTSALPNELDSQGYFRAQHQLGDPFDANNQPVVAPGLTGMLGAYWGCQDIEIGTSSSACDPYQDARGKGFFRPMAECRMRKSFFNFCRVCSAQISDAIVAIAP